MALFGAIEAGGTKFVCAIGTGPRDLRARVEFPTTAPAETIARVTAFLTEQAQHESLAAVGIASFGPIDVNPASPRFGYITSTPKAGWQNVDLAGPIRRASNAPVAFDTDVNAAALAEHRWGAALGVETFIYITVGTGIGGGGMVEGRLMHGALHPEMGHMRIPHDHQADPFPGACPFHRDCWEGLAAGPAIAARWGGKGEDLPHDHHAWQLEAHYLALGLTNLICALSPQRIILGGGIMRQTGLFPLIRTKTLELLNNYLQVKEIVERIDEYIVPPELGDDAGVLGGIALALNLVNA
ncbi:MAG TPA: ROK family protein [Terriglobia bacterium]|nr:ROK family protein [Terriglobia bacterium]